MPAERFETFKKAMKSGKLPKLLTLGDQFWEYFKEISSQQYHFNRTSVEASVLKSLSQVEVASFYKVKLLLDGYSKKPLYR